MRGYCEICNEYVDYYVEEAKGTFTVKNVEVTATIKKAYCKNCNEELFVEEIEKENDIIIYDAYKAKLGLLTSKEIKEIRLRRKLSQSQFAKILRIGQKDITRYENGAIQSASIDLLIRLSAVDEIYNDYLMKYEKKSKKENEKIEIVYPVNAQLSYQFSMEGNKNYGKAKLCTSSIY